MERHLCSEYSISVSVGWEQELVKWYEIANMKNSDKHKTKKLNIEIQPGYLEFAMPLHTTSELLKVVAFENQTQIEQLKSVIYLSIHKAFLYSCGCY